jgi:sporulation protein YlmC with PRC-barrel domain
MCNRHPAENTMKKFVYTASAIIVGLSVSVANAQTPQSQPPASAGAAARILPSIPAEAMTVTHWYKQSVYDPSDAKIGEVMDVLVDNEGRVAALIVGAGGFLGMGEKDVAVPFNAVQFKTKDNNKWYPVMNTTKEALKGAPGYKYDRNAMTWIPANATETTGTRPVAR